MVSETPIESAMVTEMNVFPAGNTYGELRRDRHGWRQRSPRQASGPPTALAGVRTSAWFIGCSS